MTYDDYEDERLNRAAVNELVNRHWDEYIQLLRDVQGERIAELERQLANTREQLAKVKSMNPDGINAPALAVTANELARENDELTAALRRKK